MAFAIRPASTRTEDRTDAPRHITAAARRGARPLAQTGLGLVLAAGGLLGGCSAQLERAEDANRALRAQNTELQGDVDALERQLQMLRAGGDDADAAVASLTDENRRLEEELRTALDSIRRLQDEARTIQFSALDPQTDEALAQLAARYPDLLRYDPERGMIRVASDLTFASGSATVTERARTSLAALADVLNSVATTGYDIRVVGHTDSEQPSGSTRERFPTNVHLSAARAIAVRDALAGLGVARDRMMVAGWGEYRPAVPNTPSGNTPENRRVELFLEQPVDGAMRGQSSPRGDRGGRAPVSIDREGLSGPRVDPSK